MGGEADLVADHLRWLRQRNIRPGTVDQRRRALGRWRRYHGSDLLGASCNQLEEFLYHRGRDLKPESRATEISHLRGFYRWAVLTERIEMDPTTRLVRPKVARRLPRPMPDADLSMALDDAPDRIRPWLMLAAYAGLRACEVAPLRGEDIWWEHQPPSLWIADGKGGIEETVPLYSALAVELADLPRRGWLFRYIDGRPGHIPAHLVSQVSNRYLHSIGITHTLHSLRHWYGTNMLIASDGNLRVTQEAMRHASPVSTALYTKVAKLEVAGAVAKLPDLSFRTVTDRTIYAAPHG